MAPPDGQGQEVASGLLKATWRLQAAAVPAAVTTPAGARLPARR